MNQAKLSWAKFILFIAAMYGILLGLIIITYPQFLLFGNPSTPFLIILIKFIGTLVGMYGIAYYFASCDPERYWHLILVGFISKLIAAMMFFYYTYTGDLHPNFIWINTWNNVIWLFPMGWVLYVCRVKESGTTVHTAKDMTF